MVQKIVGVAYENSSLDVCTEWFRNESLAELLIDNARHEDNEYHERYANGGIVDRLEFPDNIDLAKCGFNFSDDYYPKELKILFIKEHKEKLDKKLNNISKTKNTQHKI